MLPNVQRMRFSSLLFLISNVCIWTIWSWPIHFFLVQWVSDWVCDSFSVMTDTCSFSELAESVSWVILTVNHSLRTGDFQPFSACSWTFHITLVVCIYPNVYLGKLCNWKKSERVPDLKLNHWKDDDLFDVYCMCYYFFTFKVFAVSF